MPIVEKNEIERKPKNLIERFRKLDTPQISDGLGRISRVLGERAQISYEIRQLIPNTKISGSAITCKNHSGSYLPSCRAVMIAKEGDVIVMDTHGNTGGACWGGFISKEARNRGVEGLVTDGVIRDIDEIREVNFPVFARGIVAYAGAYAVAERINVPIQCCGTLVTPGDIIVADDNGVVAVPKEKAELVLKFAEAKARKEEKWMEDYKSKKISFCELWDIDNLWEEAKKVADKEYGFGQNQNRRNDS